MTDTFQLSQDSRADNPQATDDIDWSSELASGRAFKPMPGPAEQIASLEQERSQIENSLPAEKKKELNECRIGMSFAQSPAEKQQYRQRIDAIDPRFARITRDIQNVIMYAAWAPGVSRPLSNTETTAPLPHRSTNTARPSPTSHSASGTLSSIETGPRSSKAQLDEMRRRQEEWYAPFTVECTLARQRNLGIAFDRTDASSGPRLYIPLEDGGKKYLPVDRSSPIAEQLDQLAESEMERLEQAYNVKFSRAGEPVLKPFYQDQSGRYIPGNVELRARQPSLSELHAVETALMRSVSTLESADAIRLKINFLGAPTHGTELNAGEYWENLNGAPTIILFANKQVANAHLSDGQQRIWQSMVKETALHELAHHQHHKMRLHENADVLHALGWMQAQGKPGTWLFLGSAGEFYDFNAASGMWTRCNAAGEPVDMQGAKADSEKAVRLTSESVRAKALVTPASNYFDRPTEMYAEAMAHFRAGAATRGQLMQSPRLYETIKRQDQLELDLSSTYGEGRSIRLPDGTIAARTPENIDLVTSFESMFQPAPEAAPRAVDGSAGRERTQSSRIAWRKIESGRHGA